MDYLRRAGQSAEDTAEELREADEARKLRDQKNNEIVELLRNCVPQTTATEGSGTSSSAPEASSGDEAQRGSSARRDDDWRVEFRVSYNALGDDGSVHKKPAQGVFFGLHEYKYGTQFRLPWGAGAFRDTEMGASDSGRRKITGADGRVTFDLGGFKPSLGLGWHVPSRWALGGDGSSIPSSERADRAESFELGIESDWQLGLGWKDRTIKVNTHLEKIDSVVQQFAGQAGRGSDATRNVPAGLFLNDEFSIGRNFYRTYNFAEWLNLDLSPLETIPGQTGFENNTCGDSALPPNGLGSLSQATSPVQSVEDQWALEHVGLTNDVAVSEATSSDAAPIVVGVIDTGLDWNHLDLAWENIWRNEDEIPDNGIDDDGNGFVDDIIGWNFVNRDNKPWDNDGHGTFVAGIIAATHNNSTGIDGINPNARVMVLKALNNFGRTRASYVAQAIVYGADNGPGS